MPTPVEPVTGPPTVEPAARSSRLPALDVLRGFALSGILLVNAGPVTRFGSAAPEAANLGDASGWLQLLVQQRFFPVFSLLFGIGFQLLLASAARRTARPRVVLLRRLLVLLPLGLAHQLLHPGEALLSYAVFGLLVLLPSTWLPRWTTAAGAAVLVAVALVGAGGGIFLVPGLFLLGAALVRYGVVDRVEQDSPVPALLCAGFTAAAVPAVVWQLRDLPGSGFTTSSAVAGLLLAGAYVTGLLALLRTRARGVLRALFEPLGRTALTNYLGATLLVLLAGRALDLPASDSWATLLALCAGVLALQWVASTLWLRRHRHGPLEQLWRWATWAGVPPPAQGVGEAPARALNRVATDR